jgi:hypothetical protein
MHATRTITVICVNSPACRGKPTEEAKGSIEAACLLTLAAAQKPSDHSRGSEDRVMRIMHSGEAWEWEAKGVYLIVQKSTGLLGRG